jgi:hypothetical protein
MILYRFIIFALVFAGIFTHSKAQSYVEDALNINFREYSFIDVQKNYWDVSCAKPAFNEFFYEFDTLIKGAEDQVHVVHLGGSHIQADIYTHEMRRLLGQTINITASGRGLIFPFDLAQTNNPDNYQVHYQGKWQSFKNVFYKKHDKPLGVTGMAASPLGVDCAFQIGFSGTSEKYLFDRIRIYHNGTRDGCFLNVCYPDSIIEKKHYYKKGYSEYTFKMQYDSVAFSVDTAFNSAEEQSLLYGIELISNDPGLVYHSMGVNGASLPSFNHSANFSRHLASLNPDLVIVSIGTNDANTMHFDSETYKQDMVRLIHRIRQANTQVAILLTVPNDCYYQRRFVNPNTAKVQEVIKEVAEDYSCGVYDFYEVMGGKGAIDYWHALGLAAHDKVHFTREGYHLKGILFYRSFTRTWSKHLDERTINNNQCAEYLHQ